MTNRPLRDDTAYVEGLIDRIEELENQLEIVQSRLPADTWYHTKTAIWRSAPPDIELDFAKPVGKRRAFLSELLVRRLHTGLIITRRPEVFDFLLRTTHPTPEHLHNFHGEDTAP